jgi:hypothetical protein
MAVSYLHYDLHDGYIHNWLIAGPQVIEVSNLDDFEGEDVERQIVRRYTMEASGITEMPVERGPLSEGTFTIGEYEGAWSYARALVDHTVDLSDTYPTCSYLRAWAYAQVEVSSAQQVAMVLSTHGPADIWVNDEHVHRHGCFHGQRPGEVGVEVSLAEGRNEILVRLESVAMGACPLGLALRLEGLPSEAHEAAVVIPTTIEYVERRKAFERVFAAAYLDQAVYGKMDKLQVYWGDEAARWAVAVAARLRKPSGRIYAEKQVAEKPELGTPSSLGTMIQFPDGSYNVVLMPFPQEYYGSEVRITHKLPLWGLDNNPYDDELHGTLQSRRVEALKRAARYEDNVYAEMAQMAIGWWSRVEIRTLTRAIDDVNARRRGSVVDLIGLLGILARYGDDPEFPESLHTPLEEAILNFRYWHDEPGDDAMDFTGEARSILFHACEILAGQRYPDRTFGSSGQTGAWHRERGVARALAWMRERAARGFASWNSDVAFADMLTALIHLESLADEEQLWEMAAVMIDKLLFTLAVNSYQGVFGSVRRYTEAPYVQSGMLEATSGVGRLMWGMGSCNHHLRAAVSLACAESYAFPRLIQAIAADQPEAMWHRERHALGSEADEVNQVTYKTPDFMLSSAQDYRPGALGDREHLWQATLGPAAVVFVNHPACASERDARRPNNWRGNGVLPRIAQWQDALIAVHNLPADDRMGYTHAYFPIHAFDAYEIRGGWAFAKKDDGYLALTASQGITLIETGRHARYELRSHGAQNVWLCQMGRSALDGTFAEFQEKVLALDVTFEPLSARWETLRGGTLAFGWEGPFQRDGEAEPITGFNHYEGPYGVAEMPAEEMVIVFGGQAMRLHFT